MKNRIYIVAVFSLFLFLETNAQENEYGSPIWGVVKQSSPIVKTTHGLIKGENRDGVAVFRGIPYGGNCDGKMRFKAPVPAEDWRGVRDCTRNGPYAIQIGGCVVGKSKRGMYYGGGHPELFGVEDEKQSENCLVLNVVTPGLDKTKRPVVVYFHGGGFSVGNGSMVIGSNEWAREENIVVVGVNHRLNVFGYLYLGAFDKTYASSGVAGILDLILSLHWVRDNIALFGGNPDNVTIMGESGGGMKVSTLMAMEKAHGLFNKAIVESGSNLVGHLSKEEATANTKELLKNLGIDENDWRKILDIPSSVLLKAMKKNLDAYFPVGDDVNLKYQKSDNYIASEISKDIPLLVGSSEDELGSFMPFGRLGVTWENLRDKLLLDDKGGVANRCINTRNVDKVIDTFKRLNDKGDNAEHTYVKIESMEHFLGGGAFLQAQAKAIQAQANVYHYLIRYDTPIPTQTSMRCSWHTADLPLQMRIVYYPESEKISRMMSHSWAAFIRTGNPSTENLKWPAFTKNEPNVMVIDTDSRIEKDPTKELRESFSY